MIKTVLGDIKEDALGITLPHEHICRYSEYAYRMAGNDYLDKNALVGTSRIKSIASYGCFIGLDRLYANSSDEYISKKVQSILELCRAGYADQILLSHDALFFNGFDAETHICERPRFAYCFEHILPMLSESLSKKFMVSNPMRMLVGG